MDNFENIIGYENEKTELIRIRKMLKNFDDYKKAGVRITKGLILVGDPGIGKTVLVRSVATNGISEVYLTAADCVGDDSEEIIHNAFESAKAQVPAVLVLDELDKMAGEMPHFYGDDSANLKCILKEMDSLDSSVPMVVLATCNHSEYLDKAMLRSGRFDKVIHMERPDEKTREQIASYYLKKLTIKTEVDPKFIARNATGLTGADIETAVNEGAIMAMDREPPVLSENDIRVAVNRIAFSDLERADMPNDEIQLSTAVHEAAHALLAYILTPEHLLNASIIPQGNVQGFVQLAWDPLCRKSFKEYEDIIRINLAGHVAEKLVLGNYYVGSASDLRVSCIQLHYMASEEGFYGLDNICFVGKNSDGMSEETKKRIDSLVFRKLDEYSKDAERILRENRDTLDRLVKNLLEKRVLSEEEIKSICSQTI